ncbi:MORN repeat-containing protein [Mastigocladopsis repens]|uniref:hypothetical protein n=1 Tax=Mastigocladopsis repens TaxID=221287 RepID=UPI002FBF0673
MLMIITLTWLTKTTPHTDDNDNFTQLPCDSKLSPDSLPPLPKKSPDKEFKDSKYYGSFDNNLNGKGSLMFENNRFYGNFINGNLTGCGVILYSPTVKGEKKYVSVGQFVDNKLNGLGKITWEDGVEYRGNFKNGKCEGLGILKFADGTLKKGIWKKGNLPGSQSTCNR